MILSVYPVDRFGWSSRDENPVYGTIRYENRPTADQLITNLSDPGRTDAYRNNVESLVMLCRGRNIPIVLCTMAFRPEKIATYSILTDEPSIVDSLRIQMERNNRAVIEIAFSNKVPLAETAVLANEPQLFFDDVHVNEEGHVRRAEIILDVIRENGLLN
jgi:lysophospholipase L1-like esterase